MQKESLLFGFHAVMEAIKSGKAVDKIFLQKNLQGDLSKELIQLLREHKISPNTVPVEKLNKLTRKNHQGVVAFTSPVPFYDLEELIIQTQEKGATPFFILLDGVTDVRNFGAIIRSAECTGVHGIIIPKTGAAPISEDTIKTSTGAVFNVPICKVDHLKDALFLLHASGIQSVAATEKTDQLIYNIDFQQPTAIIMGAEGSGVSPGVLKTVSEKAKLPMLGDIGSLNVSVAAGTFMYEVVRQRL